jgi:large subunit ribosomal protein L18
MSGKSNIQRRDRRKIGIRKRISGSPSRPRLTVFRSATHIYAQIIDDTQGKTLVSANSLSEKIEKGGNKDGAKAVGAALAKKAVAAGITQVAFDRNGYKYHGRVQALADGARENGLKF